MMAELC